MNLTSTGASLKDSLITLLGRLNGPSEADFEDAIRPDAEAVIGRLADHLNEADLLLPDWLKMMPRAASDIGVIRSEHDSLCSMASKLATTIACRERTLARTTARTMLAMVMEHVNGENSFVDHLVPRSASRSTGGYSGEIDSCVVV